MRLLSALTLSVLAFGLIQAPASAGLVPEFDQFGTLSQATFGGSGIPKNAVAYSTINHDTDVTITLGLTATQRYQSPPLTNNSAGVFTAQPGQSVGGSTVGAAWNFNYYINISGASSNEGYTFKLDYDFDPQVGVENMGTITFGRASERILFVTNTYTSLTWQGSENLDFSFLRTGLNFGGSTAGRISVTPPASPFDPFDYNAEGSYGFRLTAFFNGNQIGDSVSILVNVGDVGPGDVSPVPEPSTLVAGVLGVGLLAGARYRRNRKQKRAIA